MLAPDNMAGSVLELQKCNDKQQILSVFLTIINSCCFTLQSNFRLLLSAPVNKTSLDSAHAGLVGVLQVCWSPALRGGLLILLLFFNFYFYWCETSAAILELRSVKLCRKQEVNSSDAAKLFPRKKYFLQGFTLLCRDQKSQNKFCTLLGSIKHILAKLMLFIEL